MAVVFVDGSPAAAPHAAAGLARHVGRVGALAVALGIGAAVATSPVPALAVPDTTGSTESSSGAESTGAQGDTAAVDSPTTASGSRTGSTLLTSPADPPDGTALASGVADTTLTTSDTPTTTLATMALVSASDAGPKLLTSPADPMDGTAKAGGGADTTLTTSVGTITTGGTNDVDITQSKVTPSASGTPGTAKAALRAADTGTEIWSNSTPTNRGVAFDELASTPADAVSSTPAGVDFQSANARMAVTTAQSAAQPAPRAFTTTALVSPTVKLAETDTRQGRPVTRVVDEVMSLAAGLASMVGLSPTLPINPLAPVGSPTPWMVLAWVRRPLKQTYFNASPLIGSGPITTSQSEGGAVTGTITTADPDGDPLELRVVTGPANGTVTVDPITGEFIYASTDSLARSGGIDSFTVAVAERNAGAHWHGVQDFLAAVFGGDRVDTARATVLVPVLPIGDTEPNGGTLDAAELVGLVADGTVDVTANADGTVRTIDGTFTETVVRNNGDAARAMNYIAGLVGADSGFADATNITSQTLVSADGDEPAEVTYRLQPTVDGIPALTSQVVLVTNGRGTVRGVFSSYNKAINNVDTSSSTSLVDESVALSAAHAALASSLAEQGDDAAATAAVLAATDSDLVIYDVDPQTAPTLARRVTLYTTVIPTDGDTAVPVVSNTYYIYADGANAGDVFATMSNLTDALATWTSTTATATDLKGNSRTITVEYQRRLFSVTYRANDTTRKLSAYAASSTSSVPGTMVTKSQSSSWDRSAVSALANTAVVYDYYRNTLGRTAFDGRGAALRVSTLPNTYNNAYWDPSLKILVFGGDYEAALDVAGHEYTHAVVTYAVANGIGLITRGESGALNESYADILGSLIENKTGSARWLIAEDRPCSSSSGCAIRDMSQPSRYGQPENYANRYTGTADYGGVHTNSGIFSFAAYKMMTDSRTSTISSATWAKVFYGSLSKLASNATFADARVAVLSTATSLGFTTTQQQAITDAFNAVGVPGF